MTLCVQESDLDARQNMAMDEVLTQIKLLNPGIA